MQSLTNKLYKTEQRSIQIPHFLFYFFDTEALMDDEELQDFFKSYITFIIIVEGNSHFPGKEKMDDDQRGLWTMNDLDLEFRTSTDYEDYILCFGKSPSSLYDQCITNTVLAVHLMYSLQCNKLFPHVLSITLAFPFVTNIDISLSRLFTNKQTNKNSPLSMANTPIIFNELKSFKS